MVSLSDSHNAFLLFLYANIFPDGFCYLSGITAPVDLEEEFISDPNGEILTLEATMQPLLLDTMTKSKDGFLGVSQSRRALLLHFVHKLLSNFSLKKVIHREQG